MDMENLNNQENAGTPPPLPPQEEPAPYVVSDNRNVPPPPGPGSFNSGYTPYKDETVTIGDWILTMLVMAIPCVNVIMLFVYAFTGDKESKKNFFKAQLIIAAVSIILSIILYIVLAAVFVDKIGDFTDWFNQMSPGFDF